MQVTMIVQLSTRRRTFLWMDIVAIFWSTTYCTSLHKRDRNNTQTPSGTWRRQMCSRSITCGFLVVEPGTWWQCWLQVLGLNANRAEQQPSQPTTYQNKRSVLLKLCSYRQALCYCFLSFYSCGFFHFSKQNILLYLHVAFLWFFFFLTKLLHYHCYY